MRLESGFRLPNSSWYYWLSAMSELLTRLSVFSGSPLRFFSCWKTETLKKQVVAGRIRLLTTQKSLICRIRDSSDVDAWSHFVDIYGPLIYRYGRRRGLQDADAADLSQTVLTEVAHCIDRFQYDATLGRFRNWLMVIARYKLSRLSQKQSRHAGRGDSQVQNLLEQQPAQDEFSEKWDAEYREHLFHWAAEQVRNEVEPSTWDAFWKTAVESKSPSEVAQSLGMKVGSVYVAKSRVLLRIRDKIAAVDDTVRAVSLRPVSEFRNSRHCRERVICFLVCRF